MSFDRSLTRITPVVVLGVLCTLPLIAQPANDCFLNIGATSVPECVASNGTTSACTAGTVRLWSDVFQPVDTTFPANRDSTSWVGATRPETRTGDEHFNWIKVIGDRAYVAYFNGFSIWNLNCNMELASCPERLSTREIFRGQWAFSQFAGGELYLLTHSLDALKASNGKTYVAINGQTGRIGLSLWDVTNASQPKQIYQDYDRDGFFVKLAEIGGQVYAFYAAIEGSPSGGVHIYNVSAADNGSQSACVENTFENDISCPGVWRGSVGNYPSTRRIDVVQKNGRTFVAHAGGFVFQGFELLEINNPASASASSRWREDVPGRFVQGVSLFELGGKIYFAAALDSANAEIRIWDVDSCLLTGSGCPNLNAPLWSEVTAAEGEDIPLTFTESTSTPFLYIGGFQRCNRGTRHEGLYDISSLPTNPNQIYEVTEGVVQGGETYADPFHSGLVDYWGRYYSRNTHGLNNIGPRTGQFYNEYFLRTASLIFDKHKYLPDADGGDPTVNVVNPGSFYFTEPVTVTATATNCQTGLWDWSNDGGCPGTVLTQGTASSTYEMTCPHPCSTPPCASWDVIVTAESCATADTTTVTLDDGRANIDAINLPIASPPNEYPVCSQLAISADVTGEPLTRGYFWELLDANLDPVTDDQGQPIRSTLPSWVLDTTGLSAEPPGPEIFLDGFESGDLTAWDGTSVGGAIVATGIVKRLSGPPIQGEGTDYTVRLTLTNEVASQGYADVEDQGFRLLPLGVLGTPDIVSEELSNGFWRFTETSLNSTQWRWEFEKGGIIEDAIDWPGEREIEYIFPEEGTWTVRVFNGQCDSQSTEFDELVVVVDVLDPPATVESFQSLTCGGSPCIAGVCVCNPGDTAVFKVNLSAGSALPDALQFDWTCNDPFNLEQTINNPTAQPDGSYSVSRVYNTSCSGADHIPQVRALTGAIPSDAVSASPPIRVFD